MRGIDVQARTAEIVKTAFRELLWRRRFWNEEEDGEDEGVIPIEHEKTGVSEPDQDDAFAVGKVSFCASIRFQVSQRHSATFLGWYIQCVCWNSMHANENVSAWSCFGLDNFLI